MKAKFIKESTLDILKPKSEKDILDALYDSKTEPDTLLINAAKQNI
jgi:hypothetical protein